MTATRSGQAEADEFAPLAHVPGSYVAGRIRNVLGFYWQTRATVAMVDALDQFCEQVSSMRKRPFSAIHVVRQDIGLPDADVRQALGASMKKFASVTSCMAVVTLGAGFWVSALQGAITGIRLLAPTGGSMLRFVLKPEDLRGWFVDEHMARTGESIPDQLLMQAVQRLLALGDSSVIH